jgi:hypothetical protein
LILYFSYMNFAKFLPIVSACVSAKKAKGRKIQRRRSEGRTYQCDNFFT